jgi:hypothetical protein
MDILKDMFWEYIDKSIKLETINGIYMTSKNYLSMTVLKNMIVKFS